MWMISNWRAYTLSFAPCQDKGAGVLPPILQVGPVVTWQLRQRDDAAVQVRKVRTEVPFVGRVSSGEVECPGAAVEHHAEIEQGVGRQHDRT